MPAHEMCRHCRAKMARYECERQGCDHRLCRYCIVWGPFDSGRCEDCLPNSGRAHCRVTD